MSLKILFVSRCAVKEEGNGGYHRTYQIWHDLCRLVGKDNVITMNLVPQNIVDTRNNKLDEYWKKFVYRLMFLGSYLSLRGNPYLLYEHLLIRMSESQSFFGNVPIEEYAQLITRLDKPSICIIDHPSHSNLVDLNIQRGIPTIVCPQNLESLDILAGSFDDKLRKVEFFPRFLQEVNMLSRCDERLCISKVEAGLLGGLGISSAYYPYLPVGAIRTRLETIRYKRENIKRTKPKQFLMLGSSDHHTTYKSFIWFIDRVINNGLPEGVHVIIVGKGTENLKTNIALPPCFDILGWLSQDMLDELLCQVNAVIIPQQIGFGALTRLPELSCAGIPAIVSLHPTYAINIPPGIVAVSDRWEEWFQKISDFSNTSPKPISVNYGSWEKEQPQPLDFVIELWRKKFASRPE